MVEDREASRVFSHRKNKGTREPDSRAKKTHRGDVWFGHSQFWDKGERLAGERRGEKRRVKNKRERSGISRSTHSSVYKSQEDVFNLRNHQVTGDSLDTLKTREYEELMEVVKQKSPHDLPYGKERLTAWLLESRLY